MITKRLTPKRLTSLGTLLVALCMPFISGCATIFSESSYNVTISSKPSKAKIIIIDEDGNEVFRGKTPALVKLDANAGFFDGETYTVLFKKKGYESVITEINREIDDWYWANLMGFVGLVVDPATGAMWELEDLKARMSPKAYAELKGKGGANELRIVMLDEVPPHLRSKLKALPSAASSVSADKHQRRMRARRK